jgi:CheY-like chemotaxis protein
MVNVLLVDDCSMDLIVLKEVVESSIPTGTNIQSYTDCKKAMEKLKSESYDLIITDIEMPEINGFDFIESINKNYNQTIIAVSGSVAENNSTETILYAANKYGADYAISKINLFNNLSTLLQKLYINRH